MASAFFTIGHSTRSVPELAGLLQQAGAGFVVDVCAFPRSRTNPQFNFDVLPAGLAERQIGYQHIQALGGLRGHRRDQGPSPNAYWENRSFRTYADYTALGAFRAGLAELREVGRIHTCAVMCAAAVWWRCHRRIIADCLIAEGERVFHKLGSGKVEPASLNPAAIPPMAGAARRAAEAQDVFVVAVDLAALLRGLQAPPSGAGVLDLSRGSISACCAKRWVVSETRSLITGMFAKG